MCEDGLFGISYLKENFLLLKYEKYKYLISHPRSNLHLGFDVVVVDDV